MLLKIQACAAYELPESSFLLLMVEPRLFGENHRVIDETLWTTQTSYSELWTDSAGNPQRRLVAPAGPFSFTFRATIEAGLNADLDDSLPEARPEEVPAAAMVYTLPSRYCQSDLLTRMAHGEFGKVKPGAKRVRAIAEWVRSRVEYRYGTTDANTSAFDTATERVGVCRDFAHLTIAFCRALSIPARYVSGYALGLDPPDFHGYAQVYLGNTWHNVDATFDGVRPALVPIAVGRDAADVAMATMWSNALFLNQTVTVTEADPGESA